MRPDREDSQIATVMRRIDARLLPLLLLMYVMAFLDRTNIGFAKNAFEASIGISEAAYALGASLFFVGYALLEVPSNVLLVRFGPKMWLSRIMVTWGLVSAATIFVHNETGFYALRLALGTAEAGFFPGVVFYLTKFYPPAQRGRAMGFFYVGAPLSFILGGPVSGLLVSLDGVLGLAGWQWLFLVEGLLTSLVGVVAFLCLADGPQSAPWLTPSQKALLADQLAESETPHHHGLLQALRAPIVLYLSAVFFIVQTSVYGLVFFLPTQVANLIGQSVGLVVGLVSTLPWIAALIGTLTLPALADRLLRHTPIATLLFVGAGLGLAGSVMLKGTAPVMLSLCLAAASFIAVQPIFWTIASRRLPAMHRAGAIALINAMGAAGSFAAPNLRVGLERVFGNAQAGVLGLAGLAMVGAVMASRLQRKGGAGLQPSDPAPHAPVRGEA